MILNHKGILKIAGIILVLFVGIAIGGAFKQNKFASVAVVSPVVFSESPSASLALSANEADEKIDGELVKVIRAVDGDTIEIEGGEKVRYIGIDTPETVDPRKPVQCFGIEASKKNKELVEGKMARLEKDVTDRDKYNRLLRYIYVGDTFVNLELVKQGFAYSYSYPPDIKYQDQFVKAQQEAREAKRGLWNACSMDPRVNPSATPQALSPAPVIQNSSAGSCVIKGNISALGKIYHLPGCGSYEKTKIDEARGEKWFCTESEAQIAGWRKALNCP
ncbi:thermonuclease family protein [Patescibacteria group bacterium]|nr:thermonuclease family protein [Patescibacteria group bacterium]